MTIDLSDDRIPADVLDEQWYALFHRVVGGLRATFRELSKLGLTQKIMAKRLGKKNPEVISRALSGHKNLTLKSLHELARAMGCRLDVTVTPLHTLKVANRAGPKVVYDVPLPPSASSKASQIYNIPPRKAA